MPEITRRRTGEMLRQLVEVLLPVPEGIQAREALAELEKRLTLSEYEKGEYASGGKRFDKIVRFATVDLVKAERIGFVVSQQVLCGLANGVDILNRNTPNNKYRTIAAIYLGLAKEESYFPNR